MKRIISVILSVIILALSLSSCALFEAVTAYGLYTKAMKTIEKAGGFEADCTMVMGIELLGEVLEIESTMNMKQNGDNSATVTDSYGVKTETVVFDGVVYSNVSGVKTKYPVPEDDESTEDEESDVASNIGIVELPELTKEVFENIEVTMNEDGTKAISIALDAESAKSLLGSMEDLESIGEGEDVTFENIVLTLGFTEKNVLDTMSFSADIIASVMGIELDSNISAEYKFVNFGTAPEISAPADADSYIDSTAYTE